MEAYLHTTLDSTSSKRKRLNMSPDVAISNGKHGPFIPPTQFAKAPHMHLRNVFFLHSLFLILSESYKLVYCLPHYWYLIAPTKSKKVVKIYYVNNSGGRQPIRLPVNESPDWIPYSCVEQLYCEVPFFFFRLLCWPTEISGIFVDSGQHPPGDRDSDAIDEELTRELNGSRSPMYEQRG